MPPPTLKPGSIFTSVSIAPIVDKDGKATFVFQKQLQDIDTRVVQALNSLGQYIGSTPSGVIIASTDNLTDGTGHPLAGGKEAYLALVASSPTTGEVLGYDGTDWVPVATVSKLIAGPGIVLSPPGGEGDQTISAPSAGLGGALTTANVVLGAGAGTGATLVLVAGLDGNHQIKVTIGSSPTANAPVFTVTFTASRGHTTYPIIQCVAVDVGHPLIDLVAGAAASATAYSGFNTGVTAGVNYNWNVSAP